ncbi:MAG: chemotaxis protein CheR, partial [Gammaproteobacteria bacterium]|nr:chemotaxis protein CheR [Gammaproteobacteria bacterium]
KSGIVESDIVESDIVVTGTDGGVDREAVSASDIRSDSKAESSQTTSFPIVGIGASAGGYEACSQLLKYLPVDTGMAFIIVQHLHPEHESALTELLSRTTSMPVVEITDSVLVEPNSVYIIPPNAELEIFHGKLQLSMRDRTIPHLPIDHFMRSLADDQGSKAIGIILSGTASDGVMGLKAIKAGGGITISQNEASAKYKGMPHSAIAAGCVDMILPPDKMAMELAYIAHHPFLQMEDVNKFGLNTKNLLEDKSELDKLFLLLRKATGIDFTYYKMPTLQRRISRRMILHKLSTIKDYVDYMLAHNDEIQALYQDILINVTEFFRDASAFDSLKEVIFPKIVSSQSGSETLRIWIPGCSTGEEVYSMAILVMEYLDQFSPISLQIFATDIDEEAIEKARQGRYKESISENVSEERLKRFFNKVDDGYQVKKSIRDFCIFAKQNVFKDPPFSRINLISCRNMLIYLGPVLQKRILSIFHYSLVPNGILFLGSAETIGEHTHLFKIVDQKNKFYSKKSLATPLNLDFSPPVLSMELDSELDVQVKKYEPWNGIDLQQKVDRIIMQKYTPAAVVINDQMKILQFRGHTGRFLEPAQGTASLNIIKMVREELLLYLRSLIQKAIETHTFVRKEKLQYHYNGNVEFVTIEITPIQHPTALDFCYLVVFEDFVPKLIEIENGN